MDLTAAEGRVLGCLIEREAADPDAYPVTLNDLRLACNQTAGRDPVVAYDDRTVEDTLLSLKSKGLARFVPARTSGDRTTRYRHRAGERWRLGPGDLVVLAVLLLHGVQAVPDVRERARRLAPFADPAQVDAVLDMLAARTPMPFAARLEAGGAGGEGGGETRWVQVLTGPAPVPAAAAAPAGDPGVSAAVGPARLPEPPSPSYANLAARVADLEQRLAAAIEGGPTYRSSDWRDEAVPPPSVPPPVAGDNHLAERVGDIERRLARIEAELAALR
jgi:uncharacterized protein YceH (UPF0502 family)